MSTIALKISNDVEQEIIAAATLSGMSITDFILSSSYQRAKEMTHEIETITLDNESRDAFLEFLNSPQEPSQTLEDLVKKNKHYLYL